jgi:hypothetical protein
MDSAEEEEEEEDVKRSGVNNWKTNGWSGAA